jgi:hypothetical protein
VVMTMSPFGTDRLDIDVMRIFQFEEYHIDLDLVPRHPHWSYSHVELLYYGQNLVPSMLEGVDTGVFERGASALLSPLSPLIGDRQDDRFLLFRALTYYHDGCRHAIIMSSRRLVRRQIRFSRIRELVLKTSGEGCQRHSPSSTCSHIGEHDSTLLETHDGEGNVDRWSLLRRP